MRNPQSGKLRRFILISASYFVDQHFRVGLGLLNLPVRGSNKNIDPDQMFLFIYWDIDDDLPGIGVY